MSAEKKQPKKLQVGTPEFDRFVYTTRQEQQAREQAQEAPQAAGKEEKV